MTNTTDPTQANIPLNWQDDTLAIRTGYTRTQEAEHNEAMFMTSSFVYDSAADAAAHFSGEKKGNIYSRFSNPTVRAFEKRLAALEGAERCVATASGMGAILTMCLAYLEAGDHLLASRALFGSSVSLFNNYMQKFGVAVSYVDLADKAAWQAAVQPNTKLIYCETPSNPLAEIADLSFLADLARQAGALFAVDNCFCTPALQKPLDFGADLVIHSATKYIDGQGRALGGAILGEHELLEAAFKVVRTGGVSMSPFNAWVFLKGLETLNLRMTAHCDSAMKIATWLESHPKVTKVHYAGLASHPAHELAKKQQRYFGGIIGFEVEGFEVGGFEVEENAAEANTSMTAKQAAWAVIDATELVSITANLGDAKSTITHPATTTHGRLTDEDKQKAGIVDGLLRLSVGLEHVDDIIADIKRGLDKL